MRKISFYRPQVQEEEQSLFASNGKHTALERAQISFSST